MNLNKRSNAKRVIKVGRDQIKALSNPTRLEIHTLLRTDGPLTAKELASLMGIEEVGLYYHLRLLASKGLIAAEQRPGTTKPETVYSIQGKFLVESFDLNVESNLEEQRKNIDTLVRAVSREQRLAGEVLRNEMHDRSVIGRSAVRLDDRKARELRKKLRELSSWLEENDGPNGDRYSLSFFLLPLVRRGK